MCGIAAVSTATPSAIADVALTVRMMAEGLVERGPDATGFAYTTRDQPWPYYWKQDEPASIAAWEVDLPEHIRTAIVHTRYATQGSPDNPDNNHPIALPGICLVHNGIITNDDDLFDLLHVERVGQVDSEAIAALLTYGEDAFSEDDPAELLALIEGDGAIAWIEGRSSNQVHLARLRDRPLWLARTTCGDLLAASTPEVIRDAVPAGVLTTVQQVPEGTYLVVEDGTIVHQASVKLPARQWYRPSVTYIPRTTVVTRTGTYTEPGIKSSVTATAPPRTFVATHTGTVDDSTDPFDDWGDEGRMWQDYCELHDLDPQTGRSMAPEPEALYG